MNTCEYQLAIPPDVTEMTGYAGTLCKAYSKSKRPDGLHWAHYPECKSENCPLKHPELLKGAILKEEQK